MKVTLEWTGNVGFSATARSFTGIQVDEPHAFHGDDRGPSAAEYLAIGVGGCLGTSFAYCLQRVEVQPKAIDVSVDVQLHHPADGQPLSIARMTTSIDVSLEGGEDEDMLKLCAESFKKYCSVSNSVVAGIPVDVQVKHVRD